MGDITRMERSVAFIGEFGEELEKHMKLPDKMEIKEQGLQVNDSGHVEYVFFGDLGEDGLHKFQLPEEVFDADMFEPEYVVETLENAGIKRGDAVQRLRKIGLLDEQEAERLLG